MRSSPVSGEPMNTVELEGFSVDVGEDGMWLDKGEFLLLTERVRHEEPSFKLADLWRSEIRPRNDGARVLQCPVCGREMEQEQLHGVTVDWCRDHGIWLDRGEYEAILNNLRLDDLYLRKVATRLWEARY